MESITQLLTELGIDHKITGEEAFASCPFHSPDRNPSWSCNVRTGIHHCFSCGASGQLAGLVSFVLDISYPEAVIYVNSRIGWAKSQKWREDYENTNFAPPSFKISEADMALFTDVPQEHLAGKKINLESATKFGVRWNPVNNSWVFPIRDPYNNNLWGWQEKNERIFRNYPSGVRKSWTLFGMDTLDNVGSLILVESPVDAVRCHAAGFRNTVSSFGVQVSDQQLSLIHNVTEHLILALDNDRAGISETARISANFKQVNVSVFNYGYMTAKDPGEMTDSEIDFGIKYTIPALQWLRNKNGSNNTK